MCFSNVRLIVVSLFLSRNDQRIEKRITAIGDRLTAFGRIIAGNFGDVAMNCGNACSPYNPAPHCGDEIENPVARLAESGIRPEARDSENQATETKKETTLRWLLNALSTSVGRKVVLAITGLLLCGFLVAHLAGNMLLHVPDGGKSYNEYAHALHKQAALLAVAEVGLFGLFIAHIVIALQVSKENRAARKDGYAVTRSKQEGRYAMEGYRPDTWMLVTGIVVLGFLILHLMDFKMELRAKEFYQLADGSALEPADKANALLSSSNLITIIGYTIGSFALIAHLAHGFQSAFQTLGINHPKYTPLIKTIGLIFAFVIGVGFASFPISGLLKGGRSPSTKMNDQRH